MVVSQDYTPPNTLDVIDAEYNTSMGTNFPDFRPIGWGKNGEFAYQIVIVRGGIGLIENSIYIISAKTDQVLDSLDLIDFETTIITIIMGIVAIIVIIIIMFVVTISRTISIIIIVSRTINITIS